MNIMAKHNNLLGVKHLGADMFDMHGRTVRINYTANKHNCTDCNSPAHFRVNEQPNNDFWYWCGNCDIGG